MIIGAGPAGLSAAMWCDELGLDTLVIEREAESRRATPQRLQSHQKSSGRRGGKRARAARPVCRAGLPTEGSISGRRPRLRALICVRSACASRAARSCAPSPSSSRRACAGRRLGIPGETELLGRGVMESGDARPRERRREETCASSAAAMRRRKMRCSQRKSARP